MNELELRAWVAQVRDGRLPRRAFVQRLAVLGIAAPLAQLMLADAGIAQTARPAYTPTKRGGGGVLRMLYWQGPTLLNPHFALGAKDADGCCLFYEPLMRYDADGNAVAVLAAELPTRANGGIAADGRSVTWKLKRDVKWHDGKPFTADDVIFNWRYATEPATAAVSIGEYEGVAGIDKIDAHTVRIRFDKPSALWARASRRMLIPKHLFEAYSGAKSREAPANLKPMGTGPYRFADFAPGDLLRGTINKDYHQPNRPHFDSVEIKGGGDAVSAARAVLQTGEFDYAWNLQVEDDVLKRLEAGGKGRVVFNPSGNTEMIFLNRADPNTEVEGERAHPKSKHPLLSDPAVRRALALLLDRASIQQGIFGRTGVATPNFVNNPPQFNSTGVKTDYAPAQAEALLEQAGWKRGGDGVRAKDGKKLKLLFQTSTNSVRQKVQQVFKQACGKAGIEVELKAITPAVYFSSDVGNPDTANKFWADLEMLANSGRAPDPDQLMLRFVSWQVSSKANKWQGLNLARWTNEEYDRAFRSAEIELDPVKRAALIIRMNDLVGNDIGVLPVVYRPRVDGIGRSMVAPLTGWDSSLAALADWYRQS